MPLVEKDCATSYKVLILGEHSVGKTAILNSLMGRKFTTSMVPTIGVDFVKKIVEVDGALVQLIIWDTAGLERFRSITRLQYGGVKEIRHSHNQYEPIPIVLCGNKKDMEDQRRVETSQGQKLASDGIAFEFFETSAKTGDNVFLAFQRLAFHITDICDPKLMKSYHPFMIKQEDTGQKEKKKEEKSGKQKKKKPKKTATKKPQKDNTTKCSLFTLSCVKPCR